MYIMPAFGRNILDKNGISRQVCLCLDCTTRITYNKNKNSLIIDKNYCAKHQPFEFEYYYNNNIGIPKKWFLEDKNLKSFLKFVFKVEECITNDDIYNFIRTKFEIYHKSIMSTRPDICEKIVELFSEKNLHIFSFKFMPNNFLNIKSNQIKLFDKFLNDINVDINTDDIYNITTEHLNNHKANTLCNYYKHSIYDLFLNLHPEIEYLPWRFKGLNYYFINKEDNSFNIENIKLWFMKEIFIKYKFPLNSEQEENIKNVLMFITNEKIRDVPGNSLIINHFDGCMFTFIDKIFPEYNIKAWERNVRIPNNYFNNIDNLKQFIEHIAENEGWIEKDEYLNLTICIIKKYSNLSADNLFGKYNTQNSGNTSIVNAIKTIYDDYEFNDNVERKYLEYYNPSTEEGYKNCFKILDDYLSEILEDNNINNHYKLRSDDFRGHKVGSIMHKYFDNKYVNMLISMYPENNYCIEKFNCNKYNAVLITLLNNYCFENAIDDLEFETTYDDLNDEKKLRFDACFTKTINNKKYIIHFEKDGQQHFREVEFYGGKKKFNKLRKHDIQKQDYINSSNNLILIRISYKETRTLKLFKEILYKLLENIHKNPEHKIFVSNNELYRNMLRGVYE